MAFGRNKARSNIEKVSLKRGEKSTSFPPILSYIKGNSLLNIFVPKKKGNPSDRRMRIVGKRSESVVSQNIFLYVHIAEAGDPQKEGQLWFWTVYNSQ